MPTGSFKDFEDALRAFESGVNPETIQSGYAQTFVTAEDWQRYQNGQMTMRELQYTSMNSLGFVGYQVGESLLIDTGYYQDSFYYGNGDTLNRWDGAFLGKDGISSLAALKTGLQEGVILAAFGKNLEYLDNYFAWNWAGHMLEEFIGTSHTYTDGRTGQQVTANYTWTGILAAAHLRGAYGLFQLMKDGLVSSDENGTSIITYINKFGGYDSYDKATLKIAFQQNQTLILAENTWNEDFDHNGTIGDGSGGSGDVTFRGQSGNQTFDGTGVMATVDYGRAAGPITADLSLTSLQAVGDGQGRDRFIDVENLIGSNYDDTLLGNDGVNHLTGGNGRDILNGRGGADVMDGGAGDDTYYVDQAGDQIIEASNGGVDTVFSAISYTLGTRLENLTLLGAGNIDGTGNRSDNILIGNRGQNVLNGGVGADIMDGGAGDDSYYVDNAGDQIIEASNGGVDTVFSAISYTLGTRLENLTLIGSGNIDGTGNRSNNNLTGNAGNNVLNGGVGADVMTGGDGNDVFYVDDAGDQVLETGNGGIDTVVSSITYTLGAKVENLTLIGDDNLGATGTRTANTLIGNSGKNVIDGGLGNDILTGGAGFDRFVFSGALDPVNNVDTITDFSVADDTVQLVRSVFSALARGPLAESAFHIGNAAADATDRIIYNSATGGLFYDADGTGAGASVQFATLHTGLAMTNIDFLVV